MLFDIKFTTLQTHFTPIVLTYARMHHTDDRGGSLTVLFGIITLHCHTHLHTHTQTHILFQPIGLTYTRTALLLGPHRMPSAGASFTVLSRILLRSCGRGTHHHKDKPQGCAHHMQTTKVMTQESMVAASKILERPCRREIK